MEEVLEAAYKPLLQHVADHINEGELRGISTQQLEVPVAIEYIAEEFAGIDAHFWGYTNDPISEKGSQHGLCSGINLENGERWELELGPAGQNGLYGKPSNWGYNPEAENNWLSQHNWHSLLRDHNETKDLKAMQEKGETLQSAYEAAKNSNTSALFNTGFQFGGHPQAKYFPDSFLIPRRDTLQQDQVDPDTFKRIRNEIALTGYINDETSSHRDENADYQGAWEVTGVMPVEDNKGNIALYLSSPGYEKEFHETMMDTVFDRGTKVTFKDVNQILG